MPGTRHMLQMLKAANDLLTHWHTAKREDCLSAIAFLKKYGDSRERALADSVAYKLSTSPPNSSAARHNGTTPQTR